MKKPKIRPSHGLEYGIQREVIQFLRDRGWHCERIVGFGWQYGLPDLIIGHPTYGIRFVEIKNSGEYNFTKAQKAKFPILDQFGFGIWILTAANNDEYEKLFGVPNWKEYWKKSWGQINIEELLKELDGI